MLKSPSSFINAPTAVHEREPLLDKVEPAPMRLIDVYKARGAPVPQAFICPLTGEIMHDPVIAECGNSFEREALEAHFKKNGYYSPTAGFQEYLSAKAPTNRSLYESIARWRRNVDVAGCPGPAMTWLAYKAPRSTGEAFVQPVVLSEGSTIDLDQLDDLVAGSSISPFPGKKLLRNWELPIPNKNLRQLMEVEGLGASLLPVARLKKVHIHSDGPTSAWNTRRQLENGCALGLAGTGCNFGAAALMLMCCAGVAPHTALVAATQSLVSFVPNMFLGCVETYRYAAANERTLKGRRDRRYRSKPALDPRFATDTSYGAGGFGGLQDDADRSAHPLHTAQALSHRVDATRSQPMTVLQPQQPLEAPRPQSIAERRSRALAEASTSHCA